MENELYHHGIRGQKWGIQNGPPYPLSDEVSTGKSLRTHETKIKKGTEPKALTKTAAVSKAKELSEEDLKKEIDRLNLEKRYVDLNKDLSRKERTDGILSRYGGQILGTAIGIATAYAVNKILNETVEAKIESKKEIKERAEIERRRATLSKYSNDELNRMSARRDAEDRYLGINKNKSKKRR